MSPVAPQPEASPPLSIVIPAYDERERLPAALAAIAKQFATRLAEIEVVVVDDGSADGTAEVAAARAEELALPLRILGSSRNRGKGYAARWGLLEARGAAVLLTDADLSVPIATVERFLRRLDAGADVVIGSRRIAGAEIRTHQPQRRERLGSAFRALASWLILPGVSDFTCGFKLFRRDAARRAFAAQRLWGWGFDVEILVIARRHAFVVAEEPVVWDDDERTRVRLWKDVVRSALDLVRIRVNDLLGRYRPSSC